MKPGLRKQKSERNRPRPSERAGPVPVVPTASSAVEGITRHKATEIPLKESEERFRLVFENSAAGMAITDLSGHIIRANKSFCDFLMFSEEELKGRSVLEITHPVDREATRANLAQAQQGGSSLYNLEKRYIRRDGEIVWGRTGIVFQFPDGSAAYGIGVVQDISQRKRAEEALQTSEALLRGILDNLQDAYFRADLSGRFTVVSPSAPRMYGYESVQEMLGLPAQTLYADANDRALLLDTVRTVGRVTDWVVACKRKDGTTFWASMNVQLCRDEAGQILGTEGVVRDISERKRAEEALRKSEERFRLLVEQASDGIGIADSHDRWIEVNSAWTAMLGFTREEILRQKAGDNVVAEEKPRVAEESARLRQGNTLRSEWKIRRKDGTVFPCEVSAKRLPDGRLQVIARDVTERKQAEELLRDSEQKERAHAKELETILETLPVLVLISRDPQCRHITANRAGYEYLELPPGTDVAQVSGVRFLRDGVEIPVQQLPLEQAAATGHPVRGAATKFVRADGTEKYSLGNAAPLFDEEGKVRGAVAASLDVTELILAEQALRESEQKERARSKELETILETLPAPVLISRDPQCRHITANRAGYEHLGLPPGTDVAQASSIRFLHRGVEVPPQQLPLEQAAATGQPVHGVATKVILPDGREKYRIANGAPLFDEEGKVRGAVAAALDVTDLVLAEEALRESEERFRTIFENVGIGAALVDRQGHPVKSNPALQKILGFTETELCNMSFTEFTHPDDIDADWKLYTELVQGQREKYEMEKRCIRKDGQVVWGQSIVSLLKNKDGSPAQFTIGTLEDITKRKRSEQELSHAHKQITQELAQRTRAEAEITRLSDRLIKAQEEERTRIARELHDHLSQQIASVSIALSNIKREIPSRLRGARREIERAYERLLSVGEGVRQLSHELHPAILEHAGLVAAMESYCAEFESLTKVSAVVHAEGRFDDLPAHVQLGIYRIAQEALHNIWKHSGATLGDIRLTRAGECLRLQIADAGVGFDPAQNSKDAGLGLVSMRERARLLGATFTVESSLGRGTSVTADIPVASPAPGKPVD